MMKTNEPSAQEQMVASEQRYRRLFEAAQDGIAILDAETGQLVDANPCLLNLLGYALDEIQGKKIWELGPFKDAFATTVKLAELQTKACVRYEDLPLETKDGRRIPVEFVSHTYRVDHQRVIQCTIRDITARKQVEAALRASEERLEFALQKSHIGGWKLDLIKHTAQRTLEHDRIFGYDALLPHWTYELFLGHVLPEDRAMVERSFREATAAQADWNFECRIRRSDGAVRWIWAVGGYQSSDAGPARYLTGIVQDITERKQVELELAREQNLLSRLIETSPDHIYFKDRASRFIKINAAQARTLGLRDPLEAVGKSDADFFSPEHANQAYADEQKIMATGEPLVGLEEKETWPDGHVTWVSTTKVALRDPAGDIVGLVGISRDITAHKAAEMALQTSEENIRLLLTNLSAGVVVHAPDTSIIFSNPMAAQLLGLTIEQLQGKQAVDPVWHFEHEDGTPMALEDYPVNRVLATCQPLNNYVVGIHRADLPQVTWVLVNAFPEFDGAQQLRQVVVTFVDINNVKRMEKQLHQAQKMEAIGTLAGGMAHDFNNILATITGHAELLMQQMKENPAAVADLAVIHQEGKRAVELTHQLLAFSQRQMLVRKIQNPNTLITTMAEALRALAGASLEVQLELETDLHPINVDQNSFRKILLELVENSHNAMPQGGRITIRTENVQVTEVEARRFPEAYAGNFMRLTVADTGPGMSAEVLAHLFNPFFSTKHLGAGLGLPSVYGAVKQQDGWIHVDSKPGGGATFYFYFPEMVTAYEERKPALPATDVGGRGERILLVEDDKSLRLLTLRFLEANGYRAVAAATAEEALDVFRREAGRFDLIFSDIVLPGMSGIELVMELLVIKPSLRVLLTSAYNDPDTRWPILKERGMCFIDKTCSLDELKATVRMLIDAGCQTPA